MEADAADALSGQFGKQLSFEYFMLAADKFTDALTDFVQQGRGFVAGSSLVLERTETDLDKAVKVCGSAAQEVEPLEQWYIAVFCLMQYPAVELQCAQFRIYGTCGKAAGDHVQWRGWPMRRSSPRPLLSWSLPDQASAPGAVAAVTACVVC